MLKIASFQGVSGDKSQPIIKVIQRKRRMKINTPRAKNTGYLSLPPLPFFRLSPRQRRVRLWRKRLAPEAHPPQAEAEDHGEFLSLNCLRNFLAREDQPKSNGGD